MVTKVKPGLTVAHRMAIYRQLAEFAPVRGSYASKFALAAFVGVMTPLAIFVVYLLLTRTNLSALYPVIAALVLACFAGFLGTLWLLRELLAPIDLTTEALAQYIDSRKLPDLPLDYPDRAGRLMEGTQYTLTQLNETINRLERVSDTDELSGVYNRRAGEKRLAEEVACAERDLQSFQIAFFDIDRFKEINDKHGHSAGDACISHIASLLQLNTRRGDWVVRWGGDEFVVGFHKNRSLKMVMERITKAIESTPCEIAPGVEARVRVSCGVAEYRFGDGAVGIIADADKAMYAAKELSRVDGLSHVCYRNELDVKPKAAAAA